MFEYDGGEGVGCQTDGICSVMGGDSGGRLFGVVVRRRCGRLGVFAVRILEIHDLLNLGKHTLIICKELN